MTQPRHTAVHAALADLAREMSVLADSLPPSAEWADACDQACCEIAQQIIPAGIADRGDQIMALAEHLSELMIAITEQQPQPFLRRVQ